MARPTARSVLPEFHERASTGTRALDPYSTLLQERIVLLGTPIDDTAAEDVVAQLMHLEHAAPDRDVSLYINSPGGSFTAMTSVYDALRFISCDVETVCLGQAASAAAVLLAAGTPGKRLVLPGARVMLRQPSLPEPARGTARDPEMQAEEAARTRALMEELLARHTGRSREEVGEDIERDTFLTAQGAVEYGIADRVVASRGAARTGAAG